jgi:RNA polymerase sigma-70 factor (ECF subfamily)
MPSGVSDEKDLVEQARAGDREAAGSLLMRHERMVHRTCRQLLPAGEDVDAAAQETLLRGLRSLPHYQGAGSFGGWLAAIAVNYCRDRLRRRRLVPFVSLEPQEDDEPGPLMVLPSSEPSPERVAMARQAVARLRREVARLPRRQHETFALRFYAGLDLDGIAAALAVDVGTVKTHLHRAVQRVRRAVEEARP